VKVKNESGEWGGKLFEMLFLVVSMQEKYDRGAKRYLNVRPFFVGIQ